MFGYHKPEDKYPVASNIELIMYALTASISATYVVLQKTGNLDILLPQPSYVIYSLFLAATFFAIGIAASLWQVEKKEPGE